MPHALLADFLGQVPLLPDAIAAELANDPSAGHTSDELKGHFDAAQQRAIAFFKEEGLPYGMVTYRTRVEACRDCGEQVEGAYWELNNCRTGRGTNIPMMVFHALTKHGKTTVEQDITNLGGAVVGQCELALDLPAIAKVLENSELPPGLMDEIKASLQEGVAK